MKISISELSDPLVYIPLYFKILTKESDLKPMLLKPAQEYYIRNRTHRDIILKARQMGISTGVMATNTHAVFTNPYNRMVLVAHKADVAEYLLQTVHRFWNNMPPIDRPKRDWSAGHRIRFPEIDCLIHIDSAESDTIGFAETINYAQLSEFSRWPAYKVKELYAGITQAVPLNGYITIESTPRGRGTDFYKLWEAAKVGEEHYKTFFFPWWWEPEYQLSPKQGKEWQEETEKVARVLNVSVQTISNEEMQLMNNFKLTPSQIAFRRHKIIELKGLFYQEYPENEVDCWLSTETNVFDGVIIRQYMQQVQRGRQEGNLIIWKDVLGGEKYVMGVDVAGGLERGDYSVASVVRVKGNEYVACLRGRIPPDLFAQEVLRLGKRYNDAEIAVERKAHGHMVLRILLESNYPNLYYHSDYDNYLSKTVTYPGWDTNVKTKSLMVDTLSSMLRAGDFISYSENLCAEAASYVWENQKATKASGSFDDELDAVMIALQLRENAPVFDAPRQKVRSYIRL